MIRMNIRNKQLFLSVLLILIFIINGSVFLQEMLNLNHTKKENYNIDEIIKQEDERHQNDFYKRTR